MAQKKNMAMTGTGGRIEKPLILDAPAPEPIHKNIPTTPKENNGKRRKTSRRQAKKI